MSQFSFNITGVPGQYTPASPGPPRREINDVIADIKAFSLYVQAMVAMQAMPQDDVRSYFQIGGIHGQPYVEWNGAGATAAQPSGWEGYCNHGNVLFPTWHRPYVAVFEQLMQSHVVTIADTYTTTDKADWQNAAANWRVPYWDWAQNSIPPTQIISDADVTIINPSGTTVSVPNPLLSYTFDPVAQGGFDTPWSQWNTTLRCPTSLAPDATSNVNELIANLTGSHDQIPYQLTHGVWVIMSTLKTWMQMSNHSQQLNPSSWGSSLEKIHDHIHRYTGGKFDGHMGDQTVAGFDTLFMLHHAPGGQAAGISTGEDGSWTIPGDNKAPVDETTGLSPFWKDNATNTYWTSDSARTFQTLGYTYPEFVGKEGLPPAALSLYIYGLVYLKYGGGPTTALSATTPVFDWGVRVRSKKFGLEGSYSVFIFLGEIPEDADAWRMSPSLVGTSEVFTRSNISHCSNCKANADMVVDGFVYLNQGLARTDLPSLKADVVVPYLKENIGWRVLKRGGVRVAMEDLPSLEITIGCVPVHLEGGETIPKAGDVRWYPEITEGMPGGHRAASD